MRRTIALAMALALTACATPAHQAASHAGHAGISIKALTSDEIAALRDGEGFGLARVAELNFYPGPRHVLDLADALGLDTDQRAATARLIAAMRHEAQRLGAEIIDAERRLDAEFADRRIDPAALAAQVAQIAALRGELRTVHLAAHIAQRALLTSQQISRYDALRGYGAAR